MACSNLDRQEEFVAKVAEINRNSKEGEILKAQTFVSKCVSPTRTTWSS